MQNYGIQWPDVVRYSKMIHYFRKADFDPKKEKTLDLSNQKMSEMLPIKLMSVFSYITFLDMSHNNIARFNGKTIANCCPLLEKLKFDHNQLNTLEDFVPIGHLKNVKELSLIGNPIMQRVEGLPLLQDLIFPPSEEKCTLVEIFTATYTMVPNAKETIDNEIIDADNIIYDEEVARKGLQKFHKQELITKPITLERRTRWVSSVIKQPCPPRAIGSFRKLQVLNGKTITVFDICMITGAKKSEEFIEKEYDQRTQKNLEKSLRAEKIRSAIAKEKPDDDGVSKLSTQYYLRRYQRRMDMVSAQFEPVFFLTEPEGEKKEKNYLQVIYKIDKINRERRIQGKDYATKQGGWDKSELNKIMNEPEIQISLGDLAREGLRMMEKKKAKIEKEKKDQEIYTEKLRKIYKFKGFKDDTKFEEWFKDLLVDGKVKLDPETDEMLKKYDREFARRKKKGKDKKIKLKLETQPEYAEESEDNEELSVVSGKSIDRVENEDMSFSQDDLDGVAFGINEVLVNEESKGGDQDTITGFLKDQVKKQQKIDRRAVRDANKALVEETNKIQVQEQQELSSLSKTDKITSTIVDQARKAQEAEERQQAMLKEVASREKINVNSMEKNPHGTNTKGRRTSAERRGKEDDEEGEQQANKERGVEIDRLDKEKDRIGRPTKCLPKNRRPAPEIKLGTASNTKRSNEDSKSAANPRSEEGLTERIGSQIEKPSGNLNIPEIEEEEIKDDIINLLKEEALQRKKISVALNKEAAPKRPQTAVVQAPEIKAPGSTALRPNQSKYIRAQQKNQFFAKSIRYQDTIQDLTQAIERPGTAAQKSFQVRQLAAIGIPASSQKTGSESNLRPNSSQISKRAGSAISSNIKIPDKRSLSKHPMTRARSMKLMLLGSRPTFSKEFKFRPKEDIYIRPNHEVKTLTPDDFPIFYDDVIPSNDEGFDLIRKIELIKLDAKNGYHIDKFIKLLKESKCAYQNYQNTKESYYLHKARADKLNIPDKVIPHAEALKYARELFPNKDYTHKDTEEFIQLFSNINSFTEPPNFTSQQLQELLRTKNLDTETKKRYEDLYLLIRSRSIHASKESDNVRKKRLQKEFEQRQHDAILAAHYLRLHDYYKNMGYDKYARDLQEKGRYIEGRPKKDDDEEEREKLLQLQKINSHGSAPEEIPEWKQWADHMKELREFKQNFDYSAKQTVGITDEMDAKYPGMKARFEKFKTKKYDNWNFEDELGKAKLRWNGGLNDSSRPDKERIFNYAKDFKDQAAKTEKLLEYSKKRFIPEMEEKYKQFVKDEDEFLKNYYDPEYRSSAYVQKLLDGTAEY